jgi:hypothetical protein
MENTYGIGRASLVSDNLNREDTTMASTFSVRRYCESGSWDVFTSANYQACMYFLKQYPYSNECSIVRN